MRLYPNNQRATLVLANFGLMYILINELIKVKCGTFGINAQDIALDQVQVFRHIKSR
jgi:hypothetical protein